MRSGFRRTEPEPRSGPNVLPVRVLICDGDRDRDWHDGSCWQPGRPRPGGPGRPGAQSRGRQAAAVQPGAAGSVPPPRH